MPCIYDDIVGCGLFDVHAIGRVLGDSIDWFHGIGDWSWVLYPLSYEL